MFCYRTEVMFARIWFALLECPSSLMTHLYSLDPNSAQCQCVWRIAGQGRLRETSRPSAGCWPMPMAVGTTPIRRLSSPVPASRYAAPRGASQDWRLCARWRTRPRHHARSATRSALSHEPQALHRRHRTICCCLCTHVTCCAG